MSRSTVTKENNGAIVVATSTNMNPKPEHISVKYHWFREYVGKECFIWKIKSENQKADIFTICLQGEYFVRIRKILCD